MQKAPGNNSLWVFCVRFSKFSYLSTFSSADSEFSFPHLLSHTLCILERLVDIVSILWIQRCLFENYFAFVFIGPGGKVKLTEKILICNSDWKSLNSFCYAWAFWIQMDYNLEHFNWGNDGCEDNLFLLESAPLFFSMQEFKYHTM